ncbi:MULTISPECIES: hypothetical protein [Pseudoalteromonas]|uniref:hypothetical protein n=1 Tax=Pseudoalteromonas TaxID=53246 RepID=UPI000CA15CAF|nr:MULTISPECIES: hypothetical protein [Pseudoalteromonas]AUJ68787.1 hypothetical protein PNC201_02250 [Pseudoalteromonas sp. NC201]UDM62893.1 hypothetical protein KIJ96_06535 [Pseudoalteromonas piscicida]
MKFGMQKKLSKAIKIKKLPIYSVKSIKGGSLGVVKHDPRTSSMASHGGTVVDPKLGI